MTDKHSTSLLKTVSSVLSAAFGVQSSKNHERDFSSGSIKAFVVAGLVFAALFIAVLYLVVSLVLGSHASP